jgi:hypothetical protein
MPLYLRFMETSRGLCHIVLSAENRVCGVDDFYNLKTVYCIGKFDFMGAWKDANGRIMTRTAVDMGCRGYIRINDRKNT